MLEWESETEEALGKGEIKLTMIEKAQWKPVLL